MLGRLVHQKVAPVDKGSVGECFISQHHEKIVPGEGNQKGERYTNQHVRNLQLQIM